MQGWFNMHKWINMIHHVNRIKDKNHIIISLDAEKAFDKNPTSLYNKSPGEVQEIYINTIQANCSNPTANINQNMEKLEGISTKIRNTTRLSTLSTSFQYST